MDKRINLLEIRIDNFAREEIRDWIKDCLTNPPRQKFAVTLNPEIILKARRDAEYKKILNSADLNLCDGFGVKLSAWLRGKKIKARFTGVELTDFLLTLASEKKMDALVVVWEKSLSRPGDIERGIEKKYNLKAQAEYFRGDDFFENGKTKNAEIVFVNFGAPEQEKFIFEKRAKFPNAKILVGVGGTFDFLTGKMKRAPRFFRASGLEWLWRLVQEPRRLKRIYNAVILFPIISLISAD